MEPRPAPEPTLSPEQLRSVPSPLQTRLLLRTSMDRRIFDTAQTITPTPDQIRETVNIGPIDAICDDIKIISQVESRSYWDAQNLQRRGETAPPAADELRRRQMTKWGENLMLNANKPEQVGRMNLLKKLLPADVTESSDASVMAEQLYKSFKYDAMTGEAKSPQEFVNKIQDTMGPLTRISESQKKDVLWLASQLYGKDIAGRLVTELAEAINKKSYALGGRGTVLHAIQNPQPLAAGDKRLLDMAKYVLDNNSMPAIPGRPTPPRPRRPTPAPTPTPADPAEPPLVIPAGRSDDRDHTPPATMTVTARRPAPSTPLATATGASPLDRLTRSAPGRPVPIDLLGDPKPRQPSAPTPTPTDRGEPPLVVPSGRSDDGDSDTRPPITIKARRKSPPAPAETPPSRRMRVDLPREATPTLEPRLAEVKQRIYDNAQEFCDTLRGRLQTDGVASNTVIDGINIRIVTDPKSNIVIRAPDTASIEGAFFPSDSFRQWARINNLPLAFLEDNSHAKLILKLEDRAGKKGFISYDPKSDKEVWQELGMQLSFDEYLEQELRDGNLIKHGDFYEQVSKRPKSTNVPIFNVTTNDLRRDYLIKLISTGASAALSDAALKQMVDGSYDLTFQNDPLLKNFVQVLQHDGKNCVPLAFYSAVSRHLLKPGNDAQKQLIALRFERDFGIKLTTRAELPVTAARPVIEIIDASKPRVATPEPAPRPTSSRYKVTTEVRPNIGAFETLEDPDGKPLMSVPEGALKVIAQRLRAEVLPEWERTGAKPSLRAGETHGFNTIKELQAFLDMYPEEPPVMGYSTLADTSAPARTSEQAETANATLQLQDKLRAKLAETIEKGKTQESFGISMNSLDKIFNRETPIPAELRDKMSQIIGFEFSYDEVSDTIDFSFQYYDNERKFKIITPDIHQGMRKLEFSPEDQIMIDALFEAQIGSVLKDQKFSIKQFEIDRGQSNQGTLLLHVEQTPTNLPPAPLPTNRAEPLAQTKTTLKAVELQQLAQASSLDQEAHEQFKTIQDQIFQAIKDDTLSPLEQQAIVKTLKDILTDPKTSDVLKMNLSLNICKLPDNKLPDILALNDYALLDAINSKTLTEKLLSMESILNGNHPLLSAIKTKYNRIRPMLEIVIAEIQTFESDLKSPLNFNNDGRANMHYYEIQTLLMKAKALYESLEGESLTGVINQLTAIASHLDKPQVAVLYDNSIASDLLKNPAHHDALQTLAWDPDMVKEIIQGEIPTKLADMHMYEGKKGKALEIADSGRLKVAPHAKFNTTASYRMIFNMLRSIKNTARLNDQSLFELTHACKMLLDNNGTDYNRYFDGTAKHEERLAILQALGVLCTLRNK